MNHYIIFAMGVVVGAMAGFFILALCKASTEADDRFIKIKKLSDKEIAARIKDGI